MLTLKKFLKMSEIHIQLGILYFISQPNEMTRPFLVVFRSLKWALSCLSLGIPSYALLFSLKQDFTELIGANIILLDFLAGGCLFL